MKKFELVFIPMPEMGHLVSMVEMANILVARDHRLAVTILAIKLPFDAKAAEYIQSLSESCTNTSIRLTVLPELSIPKESKDFMVKVLLESYKPHVREAVSKLNKTQQLVGFVLDMFCTTMVDVAMQFDVPSYVYYTSSAGYLALSLHLEEMYSQNNSNKVVERLENSDVNLAVPSLVNPVPSAAVPGIFFINNAALWFHEHAKRFRSMKGILINTFLEMEPHVIHSLSSSLQVPLYSIGPVLQFGNTDVDGSDLFDWLDKQLASSVVFLCFGSRGSFEKDQVAEIAHALEQTGVRFVWSLRQPPSNGAFNAARDYTNMEDILPEGFLGRTRDVGRVLGWAPQMEILAHPGVGGFVSHCGWNSTLESLWHGVPMAAWSLYAEQQFNAFELIVELGLAVEITMEYRKEFEKDKPEIVCALKIASGIRKLMDTNNEIRKKVKAKSEEARKSVREGGSSFVSMAKFIDDVLANSTQGGN